jgi:2-keto-3-deoxy-L-rhamnonate aldolase RhmA
VLVRVPWARPELIQAALDAGAVGIVVPHVQDASTAREIARVARFGPGGRGFAGSTRWAGFGGQDMGALLARSAEETVVVAMIEEAEGVAAAGAIAATDGIDALMLGPADLSVALGRTDQASAELAAAYDTVGRACAAAGKTFATWVPDAETGAARHAAGVRMFFAASEHAWMRAGARAAAAALKSL